MGKFTGKLFAWGLSLSLVTGAACPSFGSQYILTGSDEELSSTGKLLNGCLINRDPDDCYRLVRQYGNTSPVISHVGEIMPLVLASNQYQSDIIPSGAMCKPDGRCTHPFLGPCIEYGGAPWKAWKLEGGQYLECCFANCLACQSSIVGNCHPTDVSKIPERIMWQLRLTGSAF